MVFILIKESKLDSEVEVSFIGWRRDRNRFEFAVEAWNRKYAVIGRHLTGTEPCPNRLYLPGLSSFMEMITRTRGSTGQTVLDKPAIKKIISSKSL